MAEVKLRALAEKDLADAFRWRNDPAIWRWTRQNDFLSWENHLAWFKRQAADPTIKMYAVDEGSMLVGVCGLTSIDWPNSRAEFSLYIDPFHHGEGLGRAALTALLDHGFVTLGLMQIWGETFDTNPAAKLFESLGFKKDGTRRAFYYKAGAFTDAHLYSLLRHEWAQRKAG